MLKSGMTGSSVLKKIGVLAGLAFLAACSTTKEDRPRLSGPGNPVTTPEANPHYKVGQPYKVAGIWYYPKEDKAYDQQGIASWYGPKFHGRKTANGEIFDMNRLTAAHPTLPLPSIVEVTNMRNGRSVRVRLNDRGPFASNRIIDMSREAAMMLDFKDDGLTEVRVRYIGPASLDHAVTALGQPESYADGTYATPRHADASTAGQDTVQTRMSAGPEIKVAANDGAADELNSQMLADARQSVRETEREVVEEIVTGKPSHMADAAVLPDFNEVMETLGASPADDVWMVQIGAFSSEFNADRAASNFSDAVPIHQERIVNSSGDPLTLLRLGPYRSSGEASEALVIARNSGFGDAHIVGP